MSKHRYPTVTHPNVSRSRCRLIKRQRRLWLEKEAYRAEYELVMARLKAMLEQFEEEKMDLTYVSPEEEEAYEKDMAELEVIRDNKIHRRRDRLSKTARGRKQLAREDAKIEAWAARLANDVADLTD